MAQTVKESACCVGDLGSIPGLGRSPEGGHGNPLQYSCLENPMDRRGWRAMVHRVAKWDMTEATEHEPNLRSDIPFQGASVALVVKNLPTSAGDVRHLGSIPGSGRSPGGWHGNPLQYSCLENPMDSCSPVGHKKSDTTEAT